MQKTNEYLILHHTATDRDKTTFEVVNSYHKKKWNFKSSLGFFCGYCYFLTADGKIIQARADNEEGAHCYNWNHKSIGIALTGNFNNQQPTVEQLKSLKILIEKLSIKYNIPKDKILGHREVRGAKTSCPGDNLMVWLTEYRNTVKKICPTCGQLIK